MALFFLRKLIFQTPMRGHPVGPDVWFLVGPFFYFCTLCVRTAKALARLRRLAWAFAGRLCDKYHNLMSWLNFVCLCWDRDQFSTIRHGFSVTLPNIVILDHPSTKITNRGAQQRATVSFQDLHMPSRGQAEKQEHSQNDWTQWQSFFPKRNVVKILEWTSKIE